MYFCSAVHTENRLKARVRGIPIPSLSACLNPRIHPLYFSPFKARVAQTQSCGMSCNLIYYAFTVASSVGRCYLFLVPDGTWFIILTVKHGWMFLSGLAKPVHFDQYSLENVWSLPASLQMVKSQHISFIARCGGGLWLLGSWDLLSELFWVHYLSKTS